MTKSGNLIIAVLYSIQYSIQYNIYLKYKYDSYCEYLLLLLLLLLLYQMIDC